MSANRSRTRFTLIIGCALVLSAPNPVDALDTAVPAFPATPAASALLAGPDDPQHKSRADIAKENGDNETCSIRVTLRDRFLDWWRQNRALGWLTRNVLPDDDDKSPRGAAPAGYYLRSPLLSSLYPGASPACSDEPVEEEDVKEEDGAAVPTFPVDRGPALHCTGEGIHPCAPPQDPTEQ
jgi:hypothetical protein